jgi:hypothetical protein
MLCLSYTLFAQPKVKFIEISQKNPYLYNTSNIEYYGSDDRFDYFGINSVLNRTKFIGKFDENNISKIEFKNLTLKRNLFTVIHNAEICFYNYNYENGTIYITKTTQDQFETTDESVVYEYQVNSTNDVSLLLLHTISPDKTKYGVAFMLLDKKKKIEDLFVFVLDHKDNVIFEKDIDNEFSFNEKSKFLYLLLNDMKINNKGDVLLQMNNYPYVTAYLYLWDQINYMNYEHYFFIQENNINCVSKEVDSLRISSFKNIVLNNNNFLVYNGLYKHETLTIKNEITIFLPDGSELHKNISSVNEIKNPPSIEKYKGVFMNSRKYNNNICDIIEKPNGELYLIYDQIHFTMGKSYVYKSKNINVELYTPQLERLNNLVIPHAHIGFDFGFPSINKSGNSIFSYFDGTNLYLLYNENEKNFITPTPTKWVPNQNIYWNSNGIVLTKIDEDFKISSSNLLDIRSKQHTLKGLLFGKNNKLYIFDNKNNIGEIVLEEL